jgi:hypothetical protein
MCTCPNWYLKMVIVNYHRTTLNCRSGTVSEHIGGLHLCKEYWVRASSWELWRTRLCGLRMKLIRRAIYSQEFDRYLNPSKICYASRFSTPILWNECARYLCFALFQYEARFVYPERVAVPGYGPVDIRDLVSENVNVRYSDQAAVSSTMSNN